VSTTRPNILFLMTDQQRHDALGSVNPVYRTPALDRLAARGVRFSQAVCTVPMCVASRYSMMTGLYGFQNGVKHNTQMITRDEDLPVPVLAQRLRDAGYQTAGFGKTHWYIGSRILPDVEVKGSCRGFEVRVIRGAGDDPGNREAGAVYMAHEEPEWVRREVGERAFGPGGETVAGYVGKRSEMPPERIHEGWLTGKALEFLDSGRDPDRPFFMYLSLDFPHVGLAPPAKYEDMYDIADFPDNPPPETVPGGHREGERFKDIWYNMTSDERRRSRLRYAALCTYVDDLFGQVLQKLEAAGELENTLVIFTSDHGDMLGDRGRISKYCTYEGSVRVPLILAGPGVEGRGVADDRPAELVDVVPTLLDAAGEEVPEVLPGFSLISDFTRQASFAEMHGRGYEEYQRAPTVMWRSREWKLILNLPGPLGAVGGRYDRLRGELYHLAEDPLEMRNRYDDAECAAIRERMTAEVLMHVMCSLGRFPGGTARTAIRVTGPETKPDNSVWPSA
jgi:arylsulfatase A-like enzyme